MVVEWWYLAAMATNIDPIMSRFHAALDKIFGEQVERVVLFGSRSHGDARPDSDYDVAIFLRDPIGFGEEMRKIAGNRFGHPPRHRRRHQRPSAPCGHLPRAQGPNTGIAARRPPPLTPRAAEASARNCVS